MKIELIVVGKTNDRHLTTSINDYIGRIGHYIPFSVTVIPDLKNTKSIPGAQQKEMEGRAILKLLQPSDQVVLLDEHGMEFTSVDFARWLEKKYLASRRLIFVIGGPYGFSPSVYERANELIALSKLTFSHQMVRLIFAEQIYRACTILKGEPYHHQ